MNIWINWCRKKDKDKIYEFINAKVQEIIKQSVKNPQDIYNKVFQATAINILMKYDKLQKTNTFSSVPEFRKNKSVQITENDLKLLSVDFNDFVLSAFREQYLGYEKTWRNKIHSR